MLHVNFGDKKIRASFTVEISYWNYEHFPYSVDFALEFERQKIRLYTEAQTGIGLAGLSAGPLLEYQTNDNSIHGGFQGSVWANYFFGIDLRARFMSGTSFFCPGAYFKLPIGIFRNPDGDNSSDWDFDWD